MLVFSFRTVPSCACRNRSCARTRSESVRVVECAVSWKECAYEVHGSDCVLSVYQLYDRNLGGLKLRLPPSEESVCHEPRPTGRKVLMLPFVTLMSGSHYA